MTQDGIDFLSTTATSALTVSNSLVADNFNGIAIAPTGSVTAVFNRVEANNNGNNGIVVYGGGSAHTNTVKATVSESVAAGNTQFGFVSFTPSGSAPTSLMVFHSVAANNGTGVVAQGTGATVRLANSTVTGNATGWSVDGTSLIGSYGDNYIDGNGSNSGSLNSIPRQ
jgi:hypothetical protein